MAKNETLAKEAKSQQPEKKKIIVTKRPFTTRNGKEYQGYIIAGKLRGQDIEIDLIPVKNGKNIDGGGFELIELVFGADDTAEFIRNIEEFKIDGQNKVSTSYYVRNPDPEYPGLFVQCEVKPSRPSDKGKLEMLLQRLAV